VTFPIDPVYLNADVLTGAVRRLEDKVEIKESDNGIVESNPRWDHRRRSWVLSWALEETDEVENLFDVNGQGAGFMFIASAFGDVDDFMGVGQDIGVGDGVTTAFQLIFTAATYNESNSPPTVVRQSTRDIKYPLAGTVVMYLDGAPTLAFTVSTSTGMVTFSSPPGDGVEISADYQYAWPVRFVSETFDVTVTVNAKEIRSITVEEVFG
jgi:uncharacterized protein (TIGR02217 family)